MSTRGFLATVALVALVGAFTACNGESDVQTPSVQTPSGVGQQFAARATSVCNAALASKQEWSAFPVANFDPSQPDPSAFPEVAIWLEHEVAPTFEAWREDLNALGTPPTGRQSWIEVLAAIGTIGELNDEQVAAAKDRDVEAFVAAFDGLAAVQVELESATEAAGLASCADVHRG